MAKGRILLADDHPLVREGAQLAIRSIHPDIQVDAVASVAEAEALARTAGPYRLMLLDYRLPDADGFSGFFRMQFVLGRTPIALLSAFDDASLIAAARAIGAAGFLSKSQPLEELARSVDRLLSGQTVFPPADAEQGDDLARLQRRLKSLSNAQMRVLTALARGHLNKQIAADLCLSEATVKAHLTAIFRKLEVNNRVQAVLAVRPLFDPGASQ